LNNYIVIFNSVVFKGGYWVEDRKPQEWKLSNHAIIYDDPINFAEDKEHRPNPVERVYLEKLSND